MFKERAPDYKSISVVSRMTHLIPITRLDLDFITQQLSIIFAIVFRLLSGTMTNVTAQLKVRGYFLSCMRVIRLVVNSIHVDLFPVPR